jgi:8-oxo-dGTP pyrophosphatase MutT (NUDIX family)
VSQGPEESHAAIRTAAAVIDDGAGNVLLVRKAGTRAFMQPGGKIDAGESAVDALVRELPIQ